MSGGNNKVFKREDESKMKIFIDTADINEIRELNEWGIISGVTTNPSLIAKTGLSVEKVVREIASFIEGPISAEVIGTECNAMVEEALHLSGIAPNVIVKIPCIVEGLKAVKLLAKENIKTNVTLVFSLTQAVLAARAGASYVSPFIGRLEDRGENGVQMVSEMSQIFKTYNLNTEIIAASIRNIEHVKQMMLSGVAIATIPSGIIRVMIQHDLTNKGVEIFLADYYKSTGK